MAWIVLAWTGFGLMYFASDASVVNSATQQPTSAPGKIAYAAGGLAGAGASLVAAAPEWQLVNNVSALVGVALVTLGLAYLVQVVMPSHENAASRRR